MYLNQLHVRDFKRVHRLKIDCTHDGVPRMWTVLIGANGTGKSSILQAIALAAAGALRANRIAGPIAAQLPSLLPEAGDLEVAATFSFGSQRADDREYPEWDGEGSPETLTSRIGIKKGRSDFAGVSRYDQAVAFNDPLIEARSRNLPHWFVAGYGVHRR